MGEMLPPIAITGMGFRFAPALDTAASLWEVLEKGHSQVVSEMPASRAALFPPMEDDAPRFGAYLADVDRFDAAFFGMKGMEACYTDPNQRLLLEVSWHALEDALIDPTALKGSNIGVFIGAHTGDYNELASCQQTRINAYWNAGMNASCLANRLSYFYDFTGPSLAVNTACSSSMEALVWAVAALRMGRCDCALVGGANIILTPSVGTGAARAGMLSPMGRCKTFDVEADGFVRGEGVVVLVLKPLAQAVAQKDRIHGVIREALSAHGGHATSLTAPNLKRQRDLLISAYNNAGLQPSDISYMETHGTGTRLGDSVEVEALKEAFLSLTPATERGGTGEAWCSLGSVKTNLGHLEAAAGLAGIVKVCLAMARQWKPVLAGFENLSPFIDLSKTPFYPQAQGSSWPITGTPRRAGVSSFGFGGSYAHVILESFDEEPCPTVVSGPYVLVLSAKDETALGRQVEQFCRFFEQTQESLADIVYSLQRGRQAMSYRLAWVVSDMRQARECLHLFLDEGIATFSGVVKRRRGKTGERKPLRQDVESIAKAWVTGAPISWEVYGSPGRKVPLPCYPFSRKSYWLPEDEDS